MSRNTHRSGIRVRRDGVTECQRHGLPWIETEQAAREMLVALRQYAPGRPGDVFACPLSAGWHVGHEYAGDGSSNA